MRVVHVYKDYPPVFGGVESHIQTLAEGLKAEGVDVHVLVTNTTRKTLRGQVNGVPVTKVGRLFNISSAPIGRGFCSELRDLSQNADIVHLHVPYPPGELCQLFIRGGQHFVVTYHSDIVRQKVMGFFYRPFLHSLLRRAERITLSNPQYITLSRFLRPLADKCTVIPMGVDLSRFILTDAVHQRATAIRARYGDSPLLLFVGRLRHYKGIDVLIEAMKGIQAYALIAGDGPMGSIWKQKSADEGVMDRVIFLNAVSDEELVALYHAADMFVFPSTNRAETWGIVQVEAMACGLPVICTELGTGTSFLNQHNVTGLVIEPNNSQVLQVAIQQLIDDPALRQRLGTAGQKRAHEVFSRQAMVRQMLDFYAGVMENDLA